MIRFLFLLLLSTSAFANTSNSYALYNYELLDYQLAHNVDEVRPMASITKLFTAIIVLRSGVELNEQVKVDGKSRGRLPIKATAQRIDLMRAMLISSDNLAAESLANAHPGGYTQFLKDANEYTMGMGLIHTRIADSTGLSINNVSTAHELIRFIWRLRNNEVIREITNKQHERLKAYKGKKIFKITLKNTNPSLFEFDNILISKTGFTNPAGRCVVMIVEKDKNLYGVVILGEPTIKDRSKMAEWLLNAPVIKSIIITAPRLPKEPEPITLELNFPL